MLALILGGAIVAHVLLVTAEIVVPHANLMVSQSSELIVRGPYAMRFWSLAMCAGCALPLALLAAGALAGAVGFGLAAVLAVVGLLFYEDVWVQAGQAVPLS